MNYRHQPPTGGRIISNGGTNYTPGPPSNVYGGARTYGGVSTNIGVGGLNLGVNLGGPKPMTITSSPRAQGNTLGPVGQMGGIGTGGITIHSAGNRPPQSNTGGRVISMQQIGGATNYQPQTYQPAQQQIKNLAQPAYAGGNPGSPSKAMARQPSREVKKNDTDSPTKGKRLLPDVGRTFGSLTHDDI